MKKITQMLFVFCTIAIFCTGFVSAQMTLDPGDPFYTDVRIWVAKGYLFNVPTLRPYPQPVIDSILKTVIQKGNAAARSKAESYYEALHGTPVSVRVAGSGRILDGDNSAKQIIGEIDAEGMVTVQDNIFAAYKVGITGSNKEYDEFVLPSFALSGYNIPNDPVSVGPLSLYVEADAAIAVGTDSFYVQSGLNNTSWGDFYENSMALNQDTFHTANVSFSLRRDKWAYTQAFFALSASGSTGGGHEPSKYMSMHAADFFLADCVKITYYENMIYGRRFDFSYLLPGIPFMAAQGAAGYTDDNLQMGLAATVTPAPNWIISGDLFVDDLSLNDILKLDFDTKIRLGAQLGVTWAPDSPYVDLLTLDYTLITPYMYTHTQYDADGTYLVDMNYQNYTHYGMAMGSTLAPNSDRIALKMTFTPVERLSVTLTGSFSRHGNVNESLPTEDAQTYIDNTGEPTGTSNPNAVNLASDGSIFDYPNAGTTHVMKYTDEHLLLLAQKTMEYTVQAGFNADYCIPLAKYGRSITLKAGYLFEYIHNKGVSTDIFTHGGGTPEQQLNAWRAKMTNEINHYVSFGFEYRY